MTFIRRQLKRIEYKRRLRALFAQMDQEFLREFITYDWTILFAGLGGDCLAYEHWGEKALKGKPAQMVRLIKKGARLRQFARAWDIDPWFH